MKKIYKIQGVSHVVSTKNKFNIEHYIDFDNKENVVDNINEVHDFNISYSTNERTRAFVKIQDGCDYACSYCTIPMARGKSRSGTIKNILLKIHEIIKEGINEIVLCGINVGDFGINDNECLLNLLIGLEKIKNLKRYRISSIEPNLLNDELVKFISKSTKALPHLHIPLQSGSDTVLKSMKRRYTTEDYQSLINTIILTIFI